MKSFLRKNFWIIVALVFGSLSIVLACMIQQLRNNLEVNIVGTFYTPPEISDFRDPHYLVFNKENVYYQYQQFGPAIEGRYSIEGNVITLENDSTTEYVIYSNTMLYHIRKQDNLVYTYTRYSDIPTFVNVTS